MEFSWKPPFMGLCPKPHHPLKRVNLNFIENHLKNDFREDIIYNLKFCSKLNSATFQNCVKTEQHSCEG